MASMRKVFAAKFDTTQTDIDKMISQIGKIESNNRNIRQGERIGGGPGRGHFQFETKEGSGAFQTALNRLSNRYEHMGETVPKWIDKARKSDDARTLTREQQEDVLLADLWYKKGSDPLIKKALKTGVAKDLWLQKHWAGAEVGTKKYIEKAAQWDRHMGSVAHAALEKSKEPPKKKDIAQESVIREERKASQGLTGMAAFLEQENKMRLEQSRQARIDARKS